MGVERVEVRCGLTVRVGAQSLAEALGLSGEEYNQIFDWADRCLEERGNVLECLVEALRMYANDCPRLVLAVYTLGGLKGARCTQCQQVQQVVPVVVMDIGSLERLLRDLGGRADTRSPPTHT